MTPSLSACSARRTNFSSTDLGVAVDGTSQVALGVKKLAANVGDIRDGGSIPGLGRSSGGGNGNPLQYSYLETDRGAWWATVHGAAQSRTGLKQLSTWMVWPLFFGEEGVNSYLVILKLGLYVCETSENFRGKVWSGE